MNILYEKIVVSFIVLLEYDFWTSLSFVMKESFAESDYYGEFTTRNYLEEIKIFKDVLRRYDKP
jgi:hypothetical protein